MLKAIYLFFKKEPVYFWLFLALLAFYGFFLVSSESQSAASKPSKDMADFRDAEEKWNQEMKREGAFQEFAAREPLFASLFEGMTLFFILAFLAGLFMDARWIWKPALFARFSSDLSPPATRGWPFSILFKVILLYVLCGIALSFLMGILQSLFPRRFSYNYAMILHTLALNLVGLYFIVKFIKRSGGSWKDLGFRWGDGGIFREIRAGLVAYLGVLPLFAGVVVMLLVIAGFFHYEPPAHPLVSVFLEEEKRAPFLVGISVLLGTVAGPVFEEIFFRGFCYPIFRDRWGKFWGMVLSASFFAVIHHSGFVFWPVFILGIALAYLYEQRRSLVASITLHITHNTLFIVYFFLIKQILGK